MSRQTLLGPSNVSSNPPTRPFVAPPQPDAASVSASTGVPTGQVRGGTAAASLPPQRPAPAAPARFFPASPLHAPLPTPAPMMPVIQQPMAITTTTIVQTGGAPPVVTGGAGVFRPPPVPQTQSMQQQFQSQSIVVPPQQAPISNLGQNTSGAPPVRSTTPLRTTSAHSMAVSQVSSGVPIGLAPSPAEVAVVAVRLQRRMGYDQSALGLFGSEPNTPTPQHAGPPPGLAPTVVTVATQPAVQFAAPTPQPPVSYPQQQPTHVVMQQQQSNVVVMQTNAPPPQQVVQMNHTPPVAPNGVPPVAHAPNVSVNAVQQKQMPSHTPQPQAATTHGTPINVSFASHPNMATAPVGVAQPPQMFEARLMHTMSNMPSDALPPLANFLQAENATDWRAISFQRERTAGMKMKHDMHRQERDVEFLRTHKELEELRIKSELDAACLDREIKEHMEEIERITSRQQRAIGGLSRMRDERLLERRAEEQAARELENHLTRLDEESEQLRSGEMEALYRKLRETTDINSLLNAEQLRIETERRGNYARTIEMERELQRRVEELEQRELILEREWYDISARRAAFENPLLPIPVFDPGPTPMPAL